MSITIPALISGSKIMGAYFSKDLLLSTLSDIASCVYHSVNSVKDNNIKVFLEEIDISVRIQIIESFLKSINKSNQIKNNETILKCLHFIKETIHNIYIELQNIKKIIDNHNKNTWFAYYRSPPYCNHIKTIKMHSRLLDARYLRCVQIIECINLTSTNK